MALKVAVFVLVSSFLVTADVSSHAEDPFGEGSGSSPELKKCLRDQCFLQPFDFDPMVAVDAAPVHPPAPAPAGPLPHLVKDAQAECPGVCDGRCSLHSRKNVCHRVCMTCCLKCKCVPPGTYGYKELCGTCYTNWYTHGNQTKCP